MKKTRSTWKNLCFFSVWSLHWFCFHFSFYIFTLSFCEIELILSRRMISLTKMQIWSNEIVQISFCNNFGMSWNFLITVWNKILRIFKSANGANLEMVQWYLVPICNQMVLICNFAIRAQEKLRFFCVRIGKIKKVKSCINKHVMFRYFHFWHLGNVVFVSHMLLAYFFAPSGRF